MVNFNGQNCCYDLLGSLLFFKIFRRQTLMNIHWFRIMVPYSLFLTPVHLRGAVKGRAQIEPNDPGMASTLVFNLRSQASYSPQQTSSSSLNSQILSCLGSSIPSVPFLVDPLPLLPDYFSFFQAQLKHYYFKDTCFRLILTPLLFSVHHSSLVAFFTYPNLN